MANPVPGAEHIRALAEGLVLLSITYFAARTRSVDGPLRNALVWIGGIALLPLAIALAAEADLWGNSRRRDSDAPAFYTDTHSRSLLPLALALWLRKRDAW